MIQAKGDFYDVDGYLYKRVTSILDVIGYDDGFAAARMCGEGVSNDASELLMGLPVRNCTSTEDFVRFLANEPGEYYAGRYQERLGARADRGSLVDLAFIDMTEGAYFTPKDAEEWAYNKKQEWDAIRKITNFEYKEAKEQNLWVELESMKGKPRYPVSCDLADVADRIVCLQQWWSDYSETRNVVATQKTVKCDKRRVAGTYDVSVAGEEGTTLIDIKATVATKARHADQLAAYDDLGGGFDEWAVLRVAPDDKGRMKTWFNRVADKDTPRKRWTFAQALHSLKDEKVFARAMTKELELV